MLVKLAKESGEDQAYFLDGDSIQLSQQADMELPGLSKGDYLIFFSAAFIKGENPLRKLILNIYAPDPIEIKRIPAQAELSPIYNQMTAWVSGRLRAGINYTHPAVLLKD